jgi:hypothetical protein
MATQKRLILVAVCFLVLAATNHTLAESPWDDWTTAHKKLRADLDNLDVDVLAVKAELGGLPAFFSDRADPHIQRHAMRLKEGVEAEVVVLTPLPTRLFIPGNTSYVSLALLYVDEKLTDWRSYWTPAGSRFASVLWHTPKVGDADGDGTVDFGFRAPVGFAEADGRKRFQGRALDDEEARDLERIYQARGEKKPDLREEWYAAYHITARGYESIFDERLFGWSITADADGFDRRKLEVKVVAKRERKLFSVSQITVTVRNVGEKPLPAPSGFLDCESAYVMHSSAPKAAEIQPGASLSYRYAVRARDRGGRVVWRPQ